MNIARMELSYADPFPGVLGTGRLGEMFSIETLTRCRGIYFFYKGETLVYIGQAQNVPVRIHRHLVERKKDFDRFQWLSLPSANLDEVEADYIFRMRPTLNKALPVNSRYKQLEGVNEFCLKRLRREPTQAELDHPRTKKIRLTRYGREYYSLRSLAKVMRLSEKAQ